MTDTPSPTFAGRRLSDGPDAPDRLADPTPHAGGAPMAPPRPTVDPDLEDAPRRAIIDDIAADLAAEVDAELEAAVITLTVPGRPAYSVRYTAAVTYDELVAWTKRAGTVGSGKNKRTNELALSRIVLANRCAGIVRNGSLIIDGDGEPLTFASPAFLETVDATRAVEAVQKLYGRDVDIMHAADRVLEEAGLRDEADDDDFGEVDAPTPT